MNNRPCTLPWHHVAREMAARGCSNVEIGRAVERDQRTVQQYLNPYSHENIKAWHRRQYAENPEYRRKKLDAANARYKRKRQKEMESRTADND